MATNPMQRKARVSFMLGMLVTLLIAAVVIVLIFLQYKKTREELDSINSQKKTVWVFTQNVAYGQDITENMVQSKVVLSSGVPADWTNLGIVTPDLKEDEITEENEKAFAIKTGNATAITNIKANTVLSDSLVALKDQNDTEREQTYSVITLPIDLQTGDYIDIRIRFPRGQDYIVLSKKMAEIPAVNGTYLSDTVKLVLSEAEISTMSGAIVEAASVEGAEIYAIKYTEAAAQDAAEETYMPSKEITDILFNNQDALDNASKELMQRWRNTNVETNRNNINETVAQGNTEGATQKTQEEIDAKREAREEYVSTLVAPIE